MCWDATGTDAGSQKFPFAAISKKTQMSCVCEEYGLEAFHDGPAGNLLVEAKEVTKLLPSSFSGVMRCTCCLGFGFCF